MEKIKKGMFKLAKMLVFPPPKCHSNYALMPNGPMKHGSIGRVLYNEIKKAWTEEYEDHPDAKSLFAAISANYHIEVEAGWQAFLAEIKENDE